MRAHSSAPQDPVTAVQPIKAGRLRWLERISRFRQPIGLGITLLLFALALIACRHLLSELDLYALHDSIVQVPRAALLGAIAATVVGFVILLGYEWSASRYAGVKLPAQTLIMGGFSAFAIGNAIGLSLLSGGSVRYRLYARHGLGATDVAHMTLFASLSLGCALPPLAALATLSDLPAASVALHVPATWLGAICVAVLLLTCVLVIGIYRRRLPEQPYRDSLLVKAGRRTLRLPGRRLTLLQLIITALDVMAAATVLYLLLPQAPPFGAFLLVYLLALAAGVLSHVPGGVGVFEAILLAAFADKLGAAPLAAALLLYRLIYVLLPMLVACVLLLINEAQRLFQTRQSLRVASGLAAPILAVLVFLSGVVLLFSGVTPEIDTRLEHIGFLIPHRLVDASHFGASLVGVLCLLLAQGLRRRLSAAWMLTTVLLLVGALLSLLKGFDWEEATLLTLTASLLAVFRRSFYRPSRLTELPFSPLFLIASLCVLGASIWLLLFAYQDVPYSHELWWQFTLDADAPRSLRSLLGAAVLLVAVSLTWLLRTARPVIQLPAAEELERAKKILMASSQPDGGLALTGDKALLFHPNDEAFLMYARRGRSLVALYDPIGPTQQRAEMIWQFRDLCDTHHARPVFYQVRAENLPYYMDIGLTAIKLGEEARVDLKHFDLEAKGKEMKDLRYTWNRGTRDGLSLEIHEPGQAPMDELKVISDAWLTGKNVREKGFSLGRFSDDYLKHFRIAVIRFEGRPVAFANLLETHSHELASLDLMRAHPDAPKLTMEFMMVGLIQHYKTHDYARFSLGMVPLSGLQPRRGAPLTQRLGSMVFRRGEQLYNFQGLRRFKDKFQPDWEPRYMAVPAGLDPLVALADTAALIAGGLTGLVKR
ncbi:bifunctional lysylphosphatidylglycerol flippase/synthetase MprF [Pseudomonas fluorescens]|uniref:Phosphatidylglycerol lysyltransferase n=1 Tax=Pseudomonas fluorescens TaxID=294 RepID=A0A944DKJ7_PSEFL|nr:bifunctional lysylphosphatidylglycerol flippase/synthetase MprF [Pseudomonas fluorescens]MBT2295510.1 bifunctional lysylphosphatidylglycerol flippase/synthetase MprF [Pseudomonas fluorescens]MBT2308810.1 bifunctional lysylphosphatidylglycerol flippase/synthetase MprF [Pseudomonas fluorescens]MBT2312437.1 bifunctional lysylphosphatidylglycerol flippase/synthetase MprF [Pseudomonas fluorescens]MBT2317996.1 bifunctional lysylphosphatidylglycerol flippase/synthetase MprF [Pseudomonas fluorescens